MDTADYALIVSLCSAAVALASLAWNIWSKFIFPKPRVRVSATVAVVHWQGKISNRHLSLTATNHGPGEVTIYSANVCRTRLLLARDWGMLNPIHNFPVEPYMTLGPFSGGLPKRLPVGESITLHFAYEANSFLAVTFSRIGVNDTFGTNHWVPAKQLRFIRKTFHQDFPSAKKLPWEYDFGTENEKT